MPRINPIESDRIEGKAKALLDNVNKGLGMTPNLLRTMAHSPAVLEANLAFTRALGGGSLSAKLREQIAVAVSNANACEYCTSAHTALGRKFGVDDAELDRALRGASNDAKTEAALQFAVAIAQRRGFVTDDELDRVRSAGYTDGEVAEIIATTAHTIFTNYFNHVAQPEVDFPLVEVSAPVTV